jgi:ABC-type transport system substrate-binding protein
MFNMATSESSFPDPSTQWHSSYDIPGGNNTCQFRDGKNDQILDQMIRELDNDKYKALWQEWVININEKAPMIPLYTNTYTTLVNRRVKNFKPDTLWPWYAAILDAQLEVNEQ